MKLRRNLIIFLILVVITISSIFISLDKLGTPNPIAGSIGFAKIMYSHENYVQVRNKPKAYLAKPGVDIVEVMKKNGYKYLEEDRLGAMMVFFKDGERHLVMYSVNGYFQRWIFTE